jgi:DNA-binding response OmpR family regulator
MEKIKALFVDDDINIGNIVTTALKEEGYEVYFLNSLMTAKPVVDELKPDILILDVEIENDDGIDAVPFFRSKMPNIPILMVSSHTESSEVVRALQNGAEAYIRKPFDIQELIAYINRYAKPSITAKISISSLQLNLQTRVLSKDEKEIKRLTKLEFALLYLFYEKLNEIVTMEEIAQVWGSAIVNEHSLYNYIVKLRAALESDEHILLNSERGDGYCLKVLK